MAVLNQIARTMNLWWFVAVVFVIYIPVSYYLNYRKCSNISGPWAASVSNFWLFRATLNGRANLDCAAQLEKYGNFARISPNKIVTNDPDLWRFMSAPRSPFVKGTWYDSMALDPKYRNSLSQRDDRLHNKLRAKMIRGYSGKEIPTLETVADERIMSLIDLIRREGARGGSVDIAKCAQFFTLDVLTQIAFGAPFGYLTKNEDVFRYIENISGFLGVLELGSNSPTILSMLNGRLMAPFQPKPTDKTGMGAMLGVAKRVVNERFAPGAKHKDDMLGSFIRNGMTREEAEAESMLQILGGSDSTATAIRMTFLYILTNPSVHRKLLAEISAARAQNRVSRPVIRSAEAQRLPYLQACIREGLRMWPPLVGLQGKVAPPGGFTWTDGTFIPAGVEVGWHPQSMQRRPEIYGPDADVFRPERWLVNDDDDNADDADADTPAPRLAKMLATLDLVFGHGKYGCLGKSVAWIELEKVFVALFDTFDFALCDVLAPMRTVCHGVHVQTDLWVKVQERRELDS